MVGRWCKRWSLALEREKRAMKITLRRKRKVGSEQNFGCVWMRFGERFVLNFDLTPFSFHYQFNSASRNKYAGY
jgi:hypothetical protein